MNTFLPQMENNLLTIANRDPTDKQDAYTPYWLNVMTHELFQFTGEWVSVTKKYIEKQLETISTKF
jgi:hypothetical protein